MSQLVSIIVPVYNVAEFIDACLKSLISQSYDCTEIIVIDDGSTDSSLAICNTFKETTPNLRIIHKSNGGVSSARNIGIENAKGDWITFVDGDDLINSSFIKNLMEPLKQSNIIDFVQAGCVSFDSITGESWLEQVYDPYMGDNKNDLLSKVRGLVFSKLFKRRLLIDNKIRFNENVRLGEDMLFTLEYLRYVNKYAFVSETGYMYRRHSGSATKNLKGNYVELLNYYKYFRHDCELLYKIFKINRSEIRDSQIARYIIDSIVYFYHTTSDRSERLRFIKSNFPKQDIETLNYSCLPKSKVFLMNLLRNGQINLFDVIVLTYLKFKSLI